MVNVGAMKQLGRDLAQVAVVHLSIALIAVEVNRYLENRGRQKIQNAKEGIMRVFNSDSINLSHLNPERVSYEPKDIHTEAIQVTSENIGKLSLEFEEELFHDSTGRPYFAFTAERYSSRVDEDGTRLKEGPTELYVRLSDWIVPLRGELHIFRDMIFTNTFVFDNPRKMMEPFHGMGPSVMQFVPGEQGLPGTGVTAVNEFKPSPVPRGEESMTLNEDGPQLDWK